MGKATKLPFKVQFKRAIYPGEVIYSDMAGPLPLSNFYLFRYFVKLIDDYSRYVMVSFVMHKSDLKDVFNAFQKNEKSRRMCHL